MIEIRTITEADIEEFWQAASVGFGHDAVPLDDLVERFLAIRSLETNWVAIDHGRIVATFGHLPFDLTVPGGGTVPMAGTTVVTVASTHRRRGILTELMERHLTQAAEDLGLPVAGLWASDERIYRRFGYGPASWGQSLRIPTETVEPPPGPAEVSCRFLDVEEARTVLPTVYDLARVGRPGTLSRSDAWWWERHLEDPERRRRGASARRLVVAERSGEVVGYVLYRQRDGGPALDGERTGVVTVEELMAVDDDVRRTLWAYAAGIDLFPTVDYWNAPVDDPLALEVERFRSLKRSPVDGIWLRPLDVPRLLEARRYQGDGRLVLEVDDTTRKHGGRFLLDVDAGEARCTVTDAPVDLRLDVADLGSLYLGGLGAATLARIGRMAGAPDPVAAADRLFASTIAPWCPEVF